MLRDYRIGTRLWFGFGALLLAAAVAFAAMVFIALEAQKLTLETVERVNDRVRAVNSMIVAQLEAAVSVRNAATMSNARAVRNELEAYRKALESLEAEEGALLRRGLDDSSNTLLGAA